MTNVIRTKPAGNTGLRYKLVRWGVKRMLRDRLTPNLSVSKQRKVMEQLAVAARIPRGIKRETDELGGVPCEWLRPKHTTSDQVMLYLHGGAYVVGSFKTHGELVGNLAKAAKVKAVYIDYRLAPEHPFPAALDDALAAYKALLLNGTPAKHIILAGDSAGAGLALALMLKLKAEQLPQPACAYLISPFADLTVSSDSHVTKDAVDPVLSTQWLGDSALAYARGETHQLGNPYISPMYGDFRELPPLLIQVGEQEILFDDAIKVTDLAHAAGVNVKTTIWPNMWHDFQATAVGLPEKKAAISEFAAFTRQHTAYSA